jgi:LppM domain
MIRDMRIRARSVLLVAALIAVLTGCVKVDADLKVDKDETVSGSMLMAVDKNMVEQLGTTPDKVREEIEKSIKQDAPEGVSCKAYDEGNYVGADCTLDNVPFSEMNGSGGNDLKFQKDGERFVVSGRANAGNTPEPPDRASLPRPEVKFKITMPGKILEHDPGAKVDGDAATYSDPTKMDKIRLVSDSGGGFPLWAIIVIAALVLAAIGAVVFLMRGRRSGAGQQFPDQYPGQQYPGQQYPGQQQWGGQPGPQQQYPGQQGGQPWGQPGPQQGQPPQQWGQPGPQQGRPGPQQGEPPQWGQPGQQDPDGPGPRQ